MGKTKRPSSTKSVHELPLDEEVKRARMAKQKPKNENRDFRLPDDESSGVIDEKTSRKILSVALKQQKEIDMEEGGETKERKKFLYADVAQPSASNHESFEDDDEVEDDEAELELEAEARAWENSDLVETDIAEEDEELMKLFTKKRDRVKKESAQDVAVSNQITIYDKYLEALDALEAKRAEVDDAVSQSQVDVHGRPSLDKRVVDVYKGVGNVMSQYRSGKIPKAFKVLPVLVDWEQLLFLTKPHKWSAAAMYQATRRFSACANEKIAQRFYNLVLLPRVRDDIGEYKKLNFYLYMSLKKALFKIGAFFKGFLLPLCEEGDCSLREALIIASILAKCSIPVLHASAAMLKLAEMHYSGANSIFLKTFFNKKYALPFRVIDASVHHFLSFMNEDRKIPVLWYQCFLVFVQRYKHNFSNEQKQQLMRLSAKHYHKLVSPDIQRELQLSINKFPNNFVGDSTTADDVDHDEKMSN